MEERILIAIEKRDKELRSGGMTDLSASWQAVVDVLGERANYTWLQQAYMYESREIVLSAIKEFMK